MTLLLAGIITAIGVWIVLLKLNIRKVLNFEVPIDIVFTIGITMYFAGTFSGLMTGVVAGVVLSILLAVSKAIWGVEKINWRRNEKVAKSAKVDSSKKNS